MHIKKLREIEKHILENPLRLYMSDWIRREKAGMPISRALTRNVEQPDV